MPPANPFIDPKIAETAFLESANFRVIYNHAPILPGHSLVIPKKEILSLLQLTDEEVVEMVLLSRRAVRLLSMVFETQDFNWTIQEGESAGQTVPHLHLHLIPRHAGDLPEPGDWYPALRKTATEGAIDSRRRPKFTHAELMVIAENLRAVAARNAL